MTDKEKILIALKKAYSSLSKNIAAVENNAANCFPLLQQNLAIIGLLKSANMFILGQYVEKILSESRLTGDERRRLLDEILYVVETAQKK